MPNTNNYGPALPPKDPGLALVLALLGFVLLAGLQYFYLGKNLRGFVFLITFGSLGVGTFISLFTIRGGTLAINAQHAAGIE